MEQQMSKSDVGQTEMKEVAMPEYKIRYEDTKTGYTYCWDEVHKYWVKVCRTDELPPEIRKMVLADKELISEIKI